MKRKKPRRQSKAATRVINKILEKLKEKNIKIDYEFEYHLYDKELKKSVYYDLFFPQYKIAVEYNGSLFHYNPKKLIESKSYISLEKRKIKDELKELISNKNNIELLIIWDTDGEDKKIIEIVDFIERRYNENKIN